MKSERLEERSMRRLVFLILTVSLTLLVAFAALGQENLESEIVYSVEDSIIVVRIPMENLESAHRFYNEKGYRAIAQHTVTDMFGRTYSFEVWEKWR
jgi:hypothetical protein